MKGQVATILPFLPYIIIALVIIFAASYFIGVLTGAGPVTTIIEDISEGISGFGEAIGVVSTRDYIIEISDVRVSGTPVEGGKLTIRATYVCDFDEPCTFTARAALESGDVYVPGAFLRIADSVCCPDRKSEATKTITLEPDEYTTIEFEVTIPTADSFAVCRGYTTSWYSTSRVYFLKVGAYDGCYGRQVMDLAPIRIEAQAGVVPPEPVAYETPTATDGANINHIVLKAFVDFRECERLTGYSGHAFECAYGSVGSVLFIRSQIKNAGGKPIQFLSEAIMIPAEAYNPWGLPIGSFLMESKSCCGDSFSDGRWIEATPGAMDEFSYLMRIPHSSIRGKCNARDYYSPSRTYFVKISDYTDCGGVQVQDIAPILIRFR